MSIGRYLIGALGALNRLIDNADDRQSIREGIVLENTGGCCAVPSPARIEPPAWTEFEEHPPNQNSLITYSVFRLAARRTELRARRPETAPVSEKRVGLSRWLRRPNYDDGTTRPVYRPGADAAIRPSTPRPIDGRDPCTNAGREHPALVAEAGPGTLSQCQPAGDHGGLRRQQWLAGEAMETRAAAFRQLGRAENNGDPPAARHQQVESDRASSVRLHHPELARQAAGQSPEPAPAKAMRRQGSSCSSSGPRRPRPAFRCAAKSTAISTTEW